MKKFCSSMTRSLSLQLVWLLLAATLKNSWGYSLTNNNGVNEANRAFAARATLSSPLFRFQPANAAVTATVALKRHGGAAVVAPLHQSSFISNGRDTVASDPAPAPARALNLLSSTLTRIGLMSFILSMCIALPVTLVPQQLLYKAGVLTKLQSERMALATGQFCARWLMRLIPFCNIQTKSNVSSQDVDPEPSIWVSNHISMLDVFVLLATDVKLRGKNKRPIKIVYWKGLESNPVTKLLFQQCGFIPVDMADNGHGNDNEYDMKSFRTLLKETKRAFEEGFDVGILPEGQINPEPSRGLLPIFTGAYTLARMSKRPIQVMALHGIQNLWHPTEGMICTDRRVAVRAYAGRNMESAAEFEQTFATVAGYFGQHGTDIPSWKQWMDGTKWKELKNQQEQTQRQEEGESVQ